MSLAIGNAQDRPLHGSRLAARLDVNDNLLLRHGIRRRRRHVGAVNNVRRTAVEQVSGSVEIQISLDIEAEQEATDRGSPSPQ